MKNRVRLTGLLSLIALQVHAEDRQHFLSFIIPCYNCVGTVEESIASIYKQNMTIPFEVICTNDGSKDTTAQLLAVCEQKYPGLHVYTHSVNKGGAAARNTCVEHTQGDLIFCLDSDNVLAPNSIMPLVECLDASGCDGATFEELRYFNGNFNRSHSWYYKASDNIVTLQHIMSTYITPACSGNYLYTRESFDRAGGYNGKNRSAMDAWIFGFRQLATGSRIAVLPKTFYWHRLSSNSYWIREGRNNSLAGYETLRQFPHLFIEKTNSFLAKIDPNQRDFSSDLVAGKFELCPQEKLDVAMINYGFAGGR
jgi:glycosyltransferase involved in cell wall biosynthesis